MSSLLADLDTNGVPTLLLTPKEAATALRISEKHLWSMTVPRGPIQVVRLNRSVRYSVASLQQFIAQQEMAGAQTVEVKLS